MAKFAALRNRARLSYVDLLRFISMAYSPVPSKAGLKRKIVLTAEVSLFVAGLEHASVLDDDAEASVEAQLVQQALGGGGEDFRLLHLAAQLEKDCAIRGPGLRVLSAGEDGSGGGLGLWHWHTPYIDIQL